MEIDEIIVWFTKWTKIKVRLHLAERLVHFHEREVWWAALGANIGSEQSGKNVNFERPTLILKKFNQEMFLGVPLTSKAKEGRYHFLLTSKSAIKSCAILSQIRLMSSKRLLRRIDFIPEQEFDGLKIRIKGVL